MSASASALLLQLHGEVLRGICSKTGRHFEGLSTAARYLAAQGLIGNGSKKRLSNLDVTCAWIRHATEPKCTEFYANLFDEIEAAGSDASSALFDGIDSSSSDDVISYKAAISPSHMEVIMCPKLVALPNVPDDQGEPVALQAVISSSAAMSASEKGVQSGSGKGVQSACEKGSVSPEAVISCSAAISACEKRSVSTEAVISCNAAISAKCEKDVSVCHATPTRSSEKDELFVTPPTRSTPCTALSSLAGEKEVEEVDEEELVIAAFLQSSAVPPVPEFPALISEKGVKRITREPQVEEGSVSKEAVISCSAAISAKGAPVEKGFVSAEAVISCSVAISTCDKGPELFDIAKDDVESDGYQEELRRSDCLIQQMKAGAGLASGSLQSGVISSCAAISGIEKGCAKAGAVISSSAAISVCEKDESVDDLIARCRTLTSMAPASPSVSLTSSDDEKHDVLSCGPTPRSLVCIRHASQAAETIVLSCEYSEYDGRVLLPPVHKTFLADPQWCSPATMQLLQTILKTSWDMVRGFVLQADVFDERLWDGTLAAVIESGQTINGSEWLHKHHKMLVEESASEEEVWEE